MILPAKVWRLSGTRPLNNPQRRVAALSMLAREWPAFRRCLNKAVAGDTPATTVANFFGGLDHPFWKFHYTLTAKASPKAMALIGESRVADILANVLFPFWLTKDVNPSTPQRQVFGRNMPGSPHNCRIGASKPQPRVCLAAVLVGVRLQKRSRINKACSRFTRTFACKTTPIARNVRSQSK